MRRHADSASEWNNLFTNLPDAGPLGVNRRGGERERESRAGGSGGHSGAFTADAAPRSYPAAAAASSPVSRRIDRRGRCCAKATLTLAPGRGGARRGDSPAGGGENREVRLLFLMVTDTVGRTADKVAIWKAVSLS